MSYQVTPQEPSNTDAVLGGSNPLITTAAVLGGQEKYDSILTQIKLGREGWVYLIHAVGTKRYKIGRSINPMSRLEVLKVQSPYPLKVIRTIWTVDAVEDERKAHENLKNYRVHGEWFEFEEFGSDGKIYTGSLYEAIMTLEYCGVMADLKQEASDCCYRLTQADKNTDGLISSVKSDNLFDLLSSRDQLMKLHYFLNREASTLMKRHFNWNTEAEVRDKDAFLSGVLHCFALTVLGVELE